MGKVRIADSAEIVSRLGLGDQARIAQGAVLRSQGQPIKIGNSSGVLENSVVIATRDQPAILGGKTILGHGTILIGAQLGDLCEIGNASIILEGAQLGNRCILGEGTLVERDMVIGDDSVVLGRPARVIRKLGPQDLDMIRTMRGGDLSLDSYRENIIEGSKRGEQTMGKLYAYGDKYPSLARDVYVFSSAEITGDVKIGEGSVIASGVRIIGDSHGPIIIGKNVEILENTVLHLLPNNRLIIGDNSIIGPGSIIHGCLIGKNCIIEPGSIVCDNSQLGEGCLVKAGSLLVQRSVFQEGSLIGGHPAKRLGSVGGDWARPGWSLGARRT